MFRVVLCAWLFAAVGGCVPTGPSSREDGGPRSGAAAGSADPRAEAPSDSAGKRKTPGRALPRRHARGLDRRGRHGGSGSSAKSTSDSPGLSANATAPIDAVYRESFDGSQLGEDWNPTSPAWRIRGGRLCGKGARNHPVWLRRRLPLNARIEFDAISSSSDGDLKAEVWGDGHSAASGVSYTNASSYIAIYGGWKNRFHVLARLDEHAPDRLQIKVDPDGGDWRARPVLANQTYHFKIERNDGRTVSWLVDDIELFNFTDPKPLRGSGHQHLGFNDWEVQVCFDNLIITPLED